MAEKPKRIHIDREAGWLEMDWQDAGQLRIMLSLVRRACPCALCEDLRQEEESGLGLEMISPEQTPSIELKDAVAVGNYAIQIRWADGHDTGIYTYSYLKQLAQDVSSCN